MLGSGFGLSFRSVLLSLVVHAVLAALLFVSLDWTPTRKPLAGRPEAEPVKATMVSEAEIEQQLQEIENREKKKKLEEDKAKQRLAKLQRQAEQAERKRKEEQKRVAELERKKKAEKERAKKLALERKKEEARLAKLKEQEQAKKKREAEKKRKAELARKKKLEAERKRKAEAERKRKLAEQERKKHEAELQAQLEAERVARLVDAARGQYVPIIRQKVSRNWNQPPNTRSGIAARVKVRLSPAGEVINARIIKSSGDPIFDRSVENAVYKASPLPIPQERGINEEFRSLTLTFKPEDLIS